MLDIIDYKSLPLIEVEIETNIEEIETVEAVEVIDGVVIRREASGNHFYQYVDKCIPKTVRNYDLTTSEGRVYIEFDALE